MKLRAMFEKKVYNDGTLKFEITSPMIVLEALCAARDKLIRTEDFDTPEVHNRLTLLTEQIREIIRQHQELW